MPGGFSWENCRKLAGTLLSRYTCWRRGERGPTVEAGGAARASIHAFVNELARTVGIDAGRLRFSWDAQREITAHGSQGLALKEEFQVLTVYLEKAWRILTFSESAIIKSIQNPVLFRLAHRDNIVALLRELKRQQGFQSMLLPSAKPPEIEKTPRGTSRGL